MLMNFYKGVTYFDMITRNEWNKAEHHLVDFENM